MLYSIHMFCSIVNACYITKVSNDIFDILGNMLFMCLCRMWLMSNVQKKNESGWYRKKNLWEWLVQKNTSFNMCFLEMELDLIIALITEMVFCRVAFRRVQKWKRPSRNPVHQLCLIRRRGHGGSFSCSCVSSCFCAWNNGGRTKRWN